MGVRQAKPDLEQTTWDRAKADARLVSLGTVIGALLLAAFNAAGSQLLSGLTSGVAHVALVILGTVCGFLVGLALLSGYALLRAARNQRDELRAYIRSQEEYKALVEGFRSGCFAWADDVDRLLASQEAKEPPAPEVDLIDSSCVSRPTG